MRKQRGLTWDQVSKLLGVADNSLFFHMKSGRTGLSDKVIYRLEEAEKSAGIVVREEAVTYQATTPAARLGEIEKEQAQISRRLAEYDSLRVRYAELVEEQIDIMSKLGITRRYSDDEVAAIKERCAAKAAALKNQIKGG